MRNGGIDAVHHFGGDDGVEIFGSPILFARRFDAAIHGLRRLIPADFAFGVEQHLDQRLEMGCRRGAIDQQRLGCAAHARAAHFGVEHDFLRHSERGRLVHVDMADAFEMREHGDARFRLHAGDQAFAAARNDHVEFSVEPGQHQADRGAVAGGDKLDDGGGQSGLAQALFDGGMDGAAGPQTVRAAAQNSGIAGFQAERAGVGGHVGPAFVDDADDAKRHAHALDRQAVRPRPGFR